MIRHLCRYIIALVCLVPFTAQADIYLFTLQGGGQIEGDWLNPTEAPRKKYLVKTDLGEISIAAATVDKYVRRRPAEIELDTLRHEQPDTAEGQWALAEFCRTNGLTEARKPFLQRVVELDPDHVEARRALGYSRIDGKWQTREEAQSAKGYVKYKGRWMLPQEVEAQQLTDHEKQQRQVWHQKVELWRGWFVGNRTDEGKKNLLGITDPLAVEALAQRFKTDQSESVRLLMAEALANVGSEGAFRVLAQRSLDDPSPEVRMSCVDYLAKASRPSVVKLFLERLHDKDNNVINRAALGLKHLRDPSAIGPLIDSLITKHKILISQGTPSGATSATFGNMGGGGFAVGGGGPKYRDEPAQNQDVLDALITLTGGAVNFNFDVPSWKQWYAAQRRARGI